MTMTSARATDLTSVNLFAGVEGFGLAAERVGIRTVAAVEINDAARGVIHDRMPHTRLFRDVTEVSADDLRAAGFVPERGVFTAGFPCQDLSVAGRRAGLGGSRSGLFWHIVRLADALRPRWLVLENVTGLLSATCPCPGDHSCERIDCPGELHGVDGGVCGPGRCMVEHGGAMGAVLGALGELGYGFAYRVLDAQHLGVPQRRRRVLIVGCARADAARAAAVLLEPQSRPRNPRPLSAPREGTATGTPFGIGSGDPDVAGTIGALTGGFRTTDLDGVGAYVGIETYRKSKRAATDSDDESWVPDDRANTLNTFDGGDTRATELVVTPLAMRGRDGSTMLEAGEPGAPYNTLRAGDGGSSRHALVAIETVPLDLRNGTRSDGSTGVGTPGTGIGEPGDPCGTLGTTSPPAVATYTITPEGGQGADLAARPTELAPTLDATSDARTADRGLRIATETAVRRLTPLEYERLQGFPDNWTATSFGKPQGDGARYREMGNAVPVPVAEWVLDGVVIEDGHVHGLTPPIVEETA